MAVFIYKADLTRSALKERELQVSRRRVQAIKIFTLLEEQKLQLVSLIEAAHPGLPLPMPTPDLLERPSQIIDAITNPEDSDDDLVMQLGLVVHEGNRINMAIRQTHWSTSSTHKILGVEQIQRCREECGKLSNKFWPLTRIPDHSRAK